MGALQSLKCPRHPLFKRYPFSLCQHPRSLSQLPPLTQRHPNPCLPRPSLPPFRQKLLDLFLSFQSDSLSSCYPLQVSLDGQHDHCGTEEVARRPLGACRLPACCGRPLTQDPWTYVNGRLQPLARRPKPGRKSAVAKSEAQRPAWNPGSETTGQPQHFHSQQPHEPPWPKPQDFPMFQPTWVTESLTAKRDDSQGSQRAGDYVSPSHPPSFPAKNEGFINICRKGNVIPSHSLSGSPSCCLTLILRAAN